MPERLLHIAEAAGELGIQPSTLRQWVWRRKIAYTKVGRAVRIPASAIAELIERGTVPALETK